MPILIISDVHANLSALDAVLADAGDFGQVWFLGDLVGYGPDPAECLARLRSLPDVVALMGNHDAAVSGLIHLSAFNETARQAIRWTQSQLTNEHLAFLEKLPLTVQVRDHITLAHGSPRQPMWEYILDASAAWENFHILQTDFCFVGHSHLPSIFQQLVDRQEIRIRVPTLGEKLKLSPRMIINPGSVGQPRDHDPRAAYALLHEESMTLEFRRVAYDIAAVQRRMKDAGLPERQIIRLQEGW